MIKYLVKTTSTATEKNVRHIGEIKEYLHGKHGWSYNADGIQDWELKRIAQLDGYTTEKMAMRNYSYKHSQNGDAWTSTAEIIGIEI